MPATLSITLDTRRIKKSNKYPVKLRVTFERVTQSIIKLFLTYHQKRNMINFLHQETAI